MSDIDSLYGEAYIRDGVTDHLLEAYDTIAGELVKHFRPRSVVDVGCGGGGILRGIRNRGIVCVGIEGSSFAANHSDGLTIIQHDLREPFNSERLGLAWGGADLVISTDVGEHIEFEYHDTYCDTLRACMAPGGALFFGAAPEGQDGLGHVATAHPAHWVNLFEHRGLKLDAGGSERLRAAIKSNELHAAAWWVAKSGIVFREAR